MKGREKKRREEINKYKKGRESEGRLMKRREINKMVRRENRMVSKVKIK